VVCLWVARGQPINGAREWCLKVCFGPQEGSPVTVQVGAVVYSIGCKRAALWWCKRAPTTWFMGCKRAVRYRRKWAPKTMVSKLQEGSLVLTQEGVKSVVCRLQEGSLWWRKRAPTTWVTGCKRAAR
jgi:hypothetical protein